jgi:hypothetical protein
MNARKLMQARRPAAGATLFALLLAIANPLSGQTKLNDQARQLLAIRKQLPIIYPFTFGVISDVHVGCKREHACSGPVINCDGYTYLPHLLSDIENQPVRPEFVISCGDVTEYSFEEHYKFYHDTVAAWMDRTKIPVFTLPGNHDFYPTCPFLKGGHQNYRDWIDSVQYRDNANDYFDYFLDFGACRFLVIDNVQKYDTYAWNAAASLTGTQLARIESWMQFAPVNRFSFAHISTLYSEWAEGYAPPGYPEFQRLNESFNVRAAFYGHQHGYSHEHVGCRHDQFRVPSNLGDRGWLSVSINESVGECGLGVYFHSWSGPSQTWNTSQVYPEPNLDLPGQTVQTCKVYVADSFSAGDVGSPYIVDGNVTVKFVSPNGVVVKKGLMQVRNGGTIQIGDPQCRR